ncbi:MAG: YdbL family protein [Desulfamplus sp.]|nr:YdbL family protein [Desulfamplus sp.]MBF0390007.1 YdbL family protein [Desulfamplus sp.]
MIYFKNKKICFSVAVYTILILFVAASLNISADDIKDRMKQRLPVIVEMKKQGIIGENSSGYLEYRTNNRANQSVVDSENRDRKEVYSAIAKQQGVLIEKVEELRAAQIVQKAVSGEWLKKADGSWYQK